MVIAGLVELLQPQPLRGAKCNQATISEAAVIERVAYIGLSLAKIFPYRW